MVTIALENGSTASLSIQKELFVVTPNEVGTVAKVTSCLADAKVNIRAMWAGAVDGKGNFSILTENNRKALNMFKKAGVPKVVEREVVVVEVPNETGACWELAQKISDAGININYWYVTVDGPNAVVVLSTQDNSQVLSVLN